MRKLVFVLLALVFALSAVIVALPAKPALAQGPIIIEFPICTDPDWQLEPAISGDIVVWVDERSGEPSIYGYNLSTGTEFPISTEPTHRELPAISGNYVVWRDYRNYGLYGYDLSTGAEFPIPNSEGAFEAAISGDIVVWAGYGSEACPDQDTIDGYDFSTATPFSICIDPDARAGDPAISGDIVVWDDGRNHDTSGVDIYGYDLSTDTEFPICTHPASQGDPAISGDIVVWEDERNGEWNIYGYDLSTGTEFPICTAPDDQWQPDISGDIVVWEDYRNGYLEIYGYDLSSGEEFPICATGSNPAISGDIVVWEDDRNYDTTKYDIYGARLVQPGARAWFGVNNIFSVWTQKDTIASGTHDAIAGYGLSVINMDDDSDTMLGELVYHVEADDIGWIYLEQYAERTETSVTWTFPPEFDLVEGDWLWTGYKTKYHETREIPVSLSRDIDKIVFDSDGYQHAEFTVTFDNTDFEAAYVQIIADEYNEVEEVDAYLLVDTFSTDIPYFVMVKKDEHKIYLVVWPTDIEPGVEYNLSVDVKVELTASASPPVMYKPFFEAGVEWSYNRPGAAAGTGVVMPDDMLPEHMDYASVSTNVSNIWDLTLSYMMSSMLLEVCPCIPGDADMDGDVDVFDLVKVKRIILGIDDPTCGADADQDGDVDVFDLVKVKRIILGLEG